MLKISKKILIASNSYFNLYNFRYELIQNLMNEGYQIILIAKKDKYFHKFKNADIRCLNLNINSSQNIISNIILFLNILKNLIIYKPNLLITYTLKVNLLFTISAKILNIKQINNFFGLGYIFINRSYKTKIVEFVLSLVLSSSKKIFFQNKYDLNYFYNKNIISKKTSSKIIPGSGVNINKFKFYDLPITSKINFLFIGRLLWDKGVKEYIEAAIKIKKMNMNVSFNIIGSFETDNPSRIKKEYIYKKADNGFISFFEEVEDIRPFIIKNHCIVLPSYREGTPKSLLEGMSVGRSIITSKVPGCDHLVENNKNGYLCEVKNSLDLAKKMNLIINTPKAELKIMGINSRKIIEKKYSSVIVNNIYKNSIKKII